MRPEFIKIGGIRIRLKDISDYGVNYYRRIFQTKTKYYTPSAKNDYASEVRSEWYVGEHCQKEQSDFEVLFVKTYRNRPFFFSSSEQQITLANGTHWDGFLSSQECIDIEATLKKLDEYLS